MRLNLRIAATLLSFFAVTPAFAALVITEVASTSNAPAGTSLESRDWWELTNTGNAGVLLDGYSWEDNPVQNDRGTFPNGITIGAGESIIIHQIFTAPDTPVSADFRSAWGLPNSVQILEQSQFTGTNPFSGLSGTSGDGVNLYNPSNVLVASVAFPPATLAGNNVSTFEWGRNSASLGLSVAGENGAYQITYPLNNPTSLKATGSPGTSVPEPGTAALGGLGLCLLACGSRRKR